MKPIYPFEPIMPYFWPSGGGGGSNFEPVFLPVD